MLAAYDSGVNVLSMSLGNNNGWSETFESIVASRIVKKGVPGKYYFIYLFLMKRKNEHNLIIFPRFFFRVL